MGCASFFRPHSQRQAVAPMRRILRHATARNPSQRYRSGYPAYTRSADGFSLHRSGHPVYQRSVNGFSLHRSGVLSRSAASLKWTKSRMRESTLVTESAKKGVSGAEEKEVNKKEDVVMAVAAARDDRRAALNPAKLAVTDNPSSVSKSEPVGIGRAVYVRKGYGNQLVRDSRTLARAFSNEKVRWSLNNASYVRKRNGNQLIRDSRTIARAFSNERVRWSRHDASYVRKGYGNQPDRDPRTIARAFASEKSRWSLPNSRLRRAHLKWSKSLMRQSTLASEAARKAVAESENNKRDNVVTTSVTSKDDRLGALQDSARQAKTGSGTIDPSSSLDAVGISGAVYVRKGNGNQLVRDSRTIARAFASEKVRWSLHNARWRRAKKQAYCLYYTRFGVCQKGDGKCLYIHDPEKVAVCTKFLRGSCSDPACRLTHKVIPERMSDCSYFLEGLCTNMSCPYRHVNVNPKAPICEGFLQGYCADGDMCNKKHTNVCPEYTLTGKCSSTTCKLRHLTKTKQQLTSPAKDSVSSKRQGRYFAPSAGAQGCLKELQSTKVIAESGDEFISVDEINFLESSEENQPADKLLRDQTTDVDIFARLPKGAHSSVVASLLKPRFLLQPDVIS